MITHGYIFGAVLLIASGVIFGAGCAKGQYLTPFSEAGLSDGPGDGWKPGHDGQRVDGASNPTEAGVDLFPGVDLKPAGTITVTSPPKGVTWQAGSTQTIGWTSSGSVTSVRVELWMGATLTNMVTQNAPNTGSYSWTIPYQKKAADNYRIKIVSTDNSCHGFSSGHFSINNWKYQVAVKINATKATSSLAHHQVLLELNTSSFQFSHTNPGGADLRFSSNAVITSTFNLPYWIQQWNPSGSTWIWVKVLSIPAGSTKTIYLYYGNPSATAASSETLTFPSKFVSSGSLTLGGSKTYDWFELKGGHTLTLQAGQDLSIVARRLLIKGNIQGNGKGSPGGSGSNGAGLGGGGKSSNAGGGGGGHGSQGGQGGYDSGDSPGSGGQPYGNTTSVAVKMGSGGGSGGSNKGGSGGGGVSLQAHDVQITGSISMNGLAGSGGIQSGGGGSGGGILVHGHHVSIANNWSAMGGQGGNGGGSANDGGGGGAGGRIKIFYGGSIQTTAKFSVSGGAGGKYGTKSYGKPGGAGMSGMIKKSYGVTSVTVGSEKVL